MTNHKAKILLVEDDVNLGFLIQDYLEMLEYEVVLCNDGEKGYHTFCDIYHTINLCLIDVMMPIKDGFTLAEEIRKIDKRIPIIFLTAKNMKEDKVRGFKIGADDYITKPFSSEELGLRIEAVLRRCNLPDGCKEEKKIFQLGKFEFDYPNQQLILGDKVKSLTKREAEVLYLLSINQNELVRREVALQSIWGENDYFKGRSMDVYITKLRKYLDNDPNINIVNIHGTGFKLEVKNTSEI